MPKRIDDAGETLRPAALREVREEPDRNRIIIEIETIEYWYVGDNRGERVRFHKLVHFPFEVSQGDVENHDFEVVEARWVKPKMVRNARVKSEKILSRNR